MNIWLEWLVRIVIILSTWFLTRHVYESRVKALNELHEEQKTAAVMEYFTQGYNQGANYGERVGRMKATGVWIEEEPTEE